MKRSTNVPTNVSVKEQAQQAVDLTIGRLKDVSAIAVTAIGAFIASKVSDQRNPARSFVAAGKIESMKPNTRAMRMMNRR